MFDVSNDPHCDTGLRRDLSHFFHALTDLIVDSHDDFLAVAHRIEFCHELDQRLDGLPADRLAILRPQHVAKVVFECY